MRAQTKGHEIAAFATMLDRIDLAGVVITADALHTQQAHARYVHRHGAKYAFIVKRNQPKLHAALSGCPGPTCPSRTAPRTKVTDVGRAAPFK